VRLDDLPLNTPAMIAQIDRLALGESAARRLEAFGFVPGAQVEAIHAGVAMGPLALRIGRMTIALRRDQAAAVDVTRR